MKITKDLVGRKILYTIAGETSFMEDPIIHEGTVTDISPDGQYVRLFSILPVSARGEAWYEVGKINILSILENEEEPLEEEIRL